MFLLGQLMKSLDYVDHHVSCLDSKVTLLWISLVSPLFLLHWTMLPMQLSLSLSLSLTYYPNCYWHHLVIAMAKLLPNYPIMDAVRVWSIFECGL